MKIETIDGKKFGSITIQGHTCIAEGETNLSVLENLFLQIELLQESGLIK